MRASRALVLVFTGACASLIGIDDPAVPPDAAPDTATCTHSPCDLAPQCGCTTGMACDLTPTASGNQCRAAGTGTEATTCTTDTDCARGYTCGFRDGSGHCSKWCAMDSDCDTPRGRCADQLSQGSGGGTPIPGAVICTSSCDPLSTANSECPSGWSCDYYSLNYMGSTDDAVECRPPGTVGAGSSCAPGSGYCQAGLTCVYFTNGSDLCEHTCSPNTNTTCASGTCHSFSTPFTVNGVEYGACW
jgi:hypothetical protein